MWPGGNITTILYIHGYVHVKLYVGDYVYSDDLTIVLTFPMRSNVKSNQSSQLEPIKIFQDFAEEGANA